MGLALPPFLMGGGIKGSSSDSSSDDWGDESWTVDCPCGVTFDDGDEMVACDECEVWVHTSCCQVSKSVATYVCDRCKEKKRKEREESEVAQLLVDLPAKSVSFDHRHTAAAATSSAVDALDISASIQRRVHEQGVPGGDPSIILPSVFSRHLWKCTGYVPKLLQVQYSEIHEAPVETCSLFDACKQQAVKDSSRGLKKVKQEQPEVKVVKKLEIARNGRHKHHGKFRGVKDERGKRAREEVQQSRKKPKTASPDVLTRKAQSPKNPKAMKKSAGQEFMDVDTRVCSKCLKPEPVSADDQGNFSKPLICQECLKSRKKQIDSDIGPSEQCKKTVSQNGSPERPPTEVKQSLEHRPQSLDSVEQEKKPPLPLPLPPQEGESIDQSFSHQSSRQQKVTVMKPPDDVKRSDASVEQKVMQGCQLSIKSNTFSKSEIPSPASINSGGPSGGTVKDPALRTSPSSPTNTAPKPGSKPPGNKVPLKSPVPVKSSSSKAAGVPTFKKSDGKSSSGTTKSSSSQPAASKQSAPSKTAVSHSGLKPGLVSKKASASGSHKSGHKDIKEERSSVLKTSPTTAAAAAVAAEAPLNDEELALLLHQELNSSPRVPRVPRVRQAAAAISAQPSNILTKRALASGVSSASQKEHRLMWRKRLREDLKEGSRGSSKYAETPHLSSKRQHEDVSKSDDEASSSQAESPEASEGEDDPVSSKKPAAEADDCGDSKGNSSEPDKSRR